MRSVLAEEGTDLRLEQHPCGFAAEKDMVVAVQWNEPRAGNERGQMAAFLERHGRVAPRMHDQHRQSQLLGQFRHLDLLEAFQRPGGDL